MKASNKYPDPEPLSQTLKRQHFEESKATEGLPSICAGLGCIEEDGSGKRVGYTKGTHCLDNLKDLVRFLRRDDPQTRYVMKHLCKWNTVRNDLIPILEHYQDDRDLVLNSVKVLVFLSMPIDASSTGINEQLEYLWNLKYVITHSDAIAVVVSLLEGPLENLERDALSEDDRKLVQLVMTLFRNILAVQEISTNQAAEGSANHYLSVRDSFLALLFRENVMDLIIVLAQHIGGNCCHLRQENLLFLEIFHNIFRGQDSEYVAKVSQVDVNAKACIESLKSIMKEEEEKKKVKRSTALGRHSQFSGTFARFTMDGSKELYKGTPATSSNVLAKPKVHRGASKRIVWDQKRSLVINNDLLVSLHNFLDQFLSGAYNVLMQSIREDIEKEYQGIQHSDVHVFFQLAQFVTSYQYYKSNMTKPHSEAEMTETPHGCENGNMSSKDIICGPIAETMNQSMFDLVISKWRYTFEFLKENKDYNFLSTAASLMKFMIRVLDLVLKCEPVDSKEHQTSCILLYKLFYDQTDQGYTQYLFNLLKSFDAHKQPRSYLADLVEMIHIILRLMESLQTFGKLRVARKARRRRRKIDKANVKNMDETQANQPVVQNESSENPDAAGHEHVDVSNLNMEKDKSGSDADLVQNTEASEFEKQDAAGKKLHEYIMDSEGVADHFMDEANNDDGSSGDEKVVETDEVDFKLTTLLTSLVNNITIQNICWLLKFYKSNSASTNHYIICMLRRICDDLNLAPMLYELSYVSSFYEILEENKSGPHKDHNNIIDFLTTFVRRLLWKMESQPLLFVELLFSKTRKDCHLINAESMKHELGDMKSELKKWNHNTNEGEASAPEINRSSRPRSMADALGDDEFDVTMPSEPNDDEGDDLDQAHPEMAPDKRKQYVSESEERYSSLRSDYSDGKGEDEIAEPSKKDDSQRGSKLKRRKVFSDEMVEELRGLHEKYKDQKRCAHLIANELSPEGTITTVQVSRKLKQLGLHIGKRVKEESMPMTDEDPDNQTLASLKKRHKTKFNATSPDGEQADGKDSAALSSDDEILSSIIKKSKTSLKRKEKPFELNQQYLPGAESGGDSPHGSYKRNIQTRRSEEESVNINRHADSLSDSLNGSPEQDTFGLDNATEEGDSIGDELFDYQESDNEIEDAGNETNDRASPSSIVKRRKLRMVIDVDDEEE
ncbi:hypothetical protein V2J09_005789 [Rumex salicifolius]